MSRRQVIAFCTFWLVASSLGMALGGAASAEIGRLRLGRLGFEFPLGMASLVLFGALVATPRWLVLRRYFPRAAWWVAATAGGIIAGAWVGLIAGFVSIGAVASLDRPITFLLSPLPQIDAPVQAALAMIAIIVPFAITGATIGGAQSILLERAGAGGRTVWWVVVNGFAGVALFPLMLYAFGWSVRRPDGWVSMASAADAARFGVAYGVLTGGLLAWLLRPIARRGAAPSKPSEGDSSDSPLGADDPDRIRRSRPARYAPIAAVATLGIIAAAIVARDFESRRSWQQATAATKQLKKRMPLAEAERRLETADGVWRHVACRGGRHWYYVGSRNLDLAQGVWLRTYRPSADRTQQLVSEFGLEEGHLLRGSLSCREIPLRHT